jgi:hypothetical protein
VKEKIFIKIKSIILKKQRKRKESGSFKIFKNNTRNLIFNLPLQLYLDFRTQCYRFCEIFYYFRSGVNSEPYTRKVFVYDTLI